MSSGILQVDKLINVPYQSVRYVFPEVLNSVIHNDVKRLSDLRKLLCILSFGLCSEVPFLWSSLATQSPSVREVRTEAHRSGCLTDPS